MEGYTHHSTVENMAFYSDVYQIVDIRRKSTVDGFKQLNMGDRIYFKLVPRLEMDKYNNGYMAQKVEVYREQTDEFICEMYAKQLDKLLKRNYWVRRYRRISKRQIKKMESVERLKEESMLQQDIKQKKQEDEAVALSEEQMRIELELMFKKLEDM